MLWRSILSLLLRLLAAKIERKSTSRSEEEGHGAPEHPATYEQENSFQVFHYEISYAHSCYLSREITDLENASIAALNFGLADLASLSDGRCAWKLDGKVLVEDLKEKDAAGATSTQFKIPANLDPALKGQLARAALMRSAERNLFGSNDYLGPYALLFLPTLRLHLDDSDEVEAAVRIKLFATGIVILSFFVSESGPVDLTPFIHRRVNLGQRHLVAIDVPSALANLMVRAETSETNSLWRRPRTLRLRSDFEKYCQMESSEDGYFRLKGGGSSTLAGFALELVQTLAYCLGRPRSGLPFMILGEPREPQWIGFWSASPHVHLLHFSGQQTSAELNEELCHGALLRILMRAPPSAGKLVNTALPENLRKFDDLGIYVNESTLLWVYTLQEEAPIAAGPKHLPPFPTIHHGVKGDAIEFGPMIYRSLISELDNRDLSWDRVLSAWEKATQFELALAEAGRFGEVRENIKAALDVRGVGRLRTQVERALALRERAAAVEEGRRLSAIGIVLTVAIGFLGLPGFIRFVGTEVLLRLGCFESESDLLLLSSIGVSVLGFALVVTVARWTIQRKKWIRWVSGPN